MSEANAPKTKFTLVRTCLRDAPLEVKKSHCHTTIISLGRLVHRRTTLDECLSLMELSTNGIDEDILRGVFNDCRNEYFNDKNVDHINQIPALPEKSKRVGLVCDSEFHKVLLRKEGMLRTLPEIVMEGDKVRMKGVKGGFLNKFSEVSFRDEVVGEGDEAVTVRAYYFLGVDGCAPSSMYEWHWFGSDDKNITVEAKKVLVGFYKEYLRHGVI